MIAQLKGKIAKKTDKGIILDTGNIGYFVHLTKDTLAKTKEENSLNLYIHSHIKEDAFDLYGFEEYEQLTFFKLLISINGIGPKVALEILNIPLNKISSAIANNDEEFICEIPGIGKKTAKRIILELKGKIKDAPTENYSRLKKETHTEAVDALIKLGYQRKEIINSISSLPEEITLTEEIITYFLKNS